MVLASTSTEPSIYYKETSNTTKSARFCLKPVLPGTGNNRPSKDGEKRSDSINVQVVKGKTSTFIHLEEDEAKKG